MASQPASPTADVDVVFVAAEDDAHCRAVGSHLPSHNTVTLNLAVLRHTGVDVSTEGMELRFPDGDPLRVSSKTTVWWRRPGSTPVSDLDEEEARLVTDENLHMLVGALDSAGVRWIDHPDVLARAERKLYQLAVARSLGIPPPSTIVSNRVESARTFAGSRSVVTKPLSPGVGIAPFTSLIEPSNLDLVENNPSLLQECITASADLRVVVTGGEVWVWRRPRDAALDWRAVDPGGQGFCLVDDPPQALAGQAVVLTAALGLTSSVQDWLETDTHPVFLEVNPQGNWLFLSGATQVLAPAFARLVSGDPPLSHGTWPGPWRRLANDFRSAAKAPPSDGIDAPVWLPPVHLRSLAEWDGSIEVVRRAHDAAVHAVAVAEAKASRLVQTSLALIALGVALISLQIGSAETSVGQALALIPLAAVLLLSIAALEASQIDRVGMYNTPRLSDLTSRVVEPQLALLEAEEKGRVMARWTADHKLTELLNAHAWFTRGLTALIVSGLVTAVTWGISRG